MPSSLSTLQMTVQAVPWKRPLWQQSPDGTQTRFALARERVFSLGRKTQLHEFCRQLGFAPSRFHLDTPGSSQEARGTLPQSSALQRIGCALLVVSDIPRQVPMKTCFAKKSAHKVHVNSFPNRKPAGKVLNSPCLVMGQSTESFRREVTYRV